MIGNIDILVKELCKLPKEVGWVEFKHNNFEQIWQLYSNDTERRIL